MNLLELRIIISSTKLGSSGYEVTLIIPPPKAPCNSTAWPRRQQASRYNGISMTTDTFPADLLDRSIESTYSSS
ncbi:hypothetical protein Pfo_004779 [Paulownia fortunei]|nr:hypothetical protein Pfo_004779 [Paulownia fortunei]